MRYRLNEPDVIQETVDGDTLIVNTRTGTYYNVGGSGAQVWNALLAGRSVEQAVDEFVDSTDPQRALIHAGVGGFVDALLAEQLLLPSADNSDNEKASPTPASTPKVPFTTPELRKFTDMQELLLVDPIHEVDPAAGWPLPKNPKPAD